MSERDPDRDLVESAQAQLPYGTSAYNELVRRHSDAVYRRCYRILQSEADAEEATQDAFFAVYQGLPRFRPEKPFVRWLSVVTLNSCRMLLRRRASEQRRRAALEAKSPPRPQPAPRNGVLRRLVIGLLDELDPAVRIPVLLHYLEGYTYTEIAEQLDVSESAAKMRVSRGARRLRELYEERTLSPPSAAGAGEATDG
ncbi:MAG: RNA polymerase sigma factor [Myxococcota bacterium]